MEINNNLFNMQEIQKRIIFYYIENKESLINFLITFANLQNKQSEFFIYIPELHEIFNVNIKHLI